MMKKLLVFIAISFLCFCFAQAENNIRTVKIKYLVYDNLTGKYYKEIDAVDGYEMLPTNNQVLINNHSKVTPIAIFQNTTSAEELQFYYSLKIFNAYENKEVFSQDGWVTGNLLANPKISDIQYVDADGNELPYPTANYKSGLPPGGYMKVYFKDFIPVDSIKFHHGNLTVSAFSKNLSYPDNKPFPNEDLSDDTVKVSLECLRFNSELGMEYYESNPKSGVTIPSPYFWINKGAELVDGNVFCNQLINGVDAIYDTLTQKLVVKNRFAPVYRLNRLALDGTDEAKNGRGGDTLTSQIIDVRGRFGLILEFLLQRTGKIPTVFQRGWSDSLMLGPEHRVVQNLGDSNFVVRKSDNLVVEYLFSTNKDLEKLINPKESDWNNHPRRQGAPPIKNNPALTIFGGGGRIVSSLENDKDSALSVEQGLREDFSDNGKDDLFSLNTKIGRAHV